LHKKHSKNYKSRQSQNGVDSAQHPSADPVVLPLLDTKVSLC